MKDLPHPHNDAGGFAGHAFQTLVAGTVCGFLAIVLSISYGNLLLPAGMRGFLPAAIGMAIFTTTVAAAIAALTSSIRGVVPIAQDIPIVALAAVAAAIAADLAGQAPDREAFVTIVAAVVLSMLATAVTLLLLGFFRLGGLIRFIPFPVVGGFLAGTGWLIARGGLTVMAGEPVTLSSLHLLADPIVASKLASAFAFIALVLLIRTRSDSTLVLPVTVFAVVVLFNLVVLAGGFPIGTLQDTGWLIPLPSGESLWPPVVPADLALVNWTALFSEFVSLPAITLVTVLALLMNATGIELDTGRDIDLNRELRSVGWQNLAAAGGGGLPGYLTVSLSILSSQLGAASRATSVIVAVLGAAALVFGEVVLNVMPTPIFGSLLVWVGGSLLVQWLIQSYRRLTAAEYLIIVVIFVVIVGVDFMWGILVGLVAALILFVLQYGQVDVVRHVLRGSDYQSNVETHDSRRDALQRHGDAILILSLQGYLFFGTAYRLRQRVLSEITAAADTVRFVLIDFRRVTGLDSSGVLSFVRLAQGAEQAGFSLVLTGMSNEVRKAVLRGGLHPDALPAVRLEADAEHALETCERVLLADVAPELAGNHAVDFTEMLAAFIDDEAVVSQLADSFERVEVPAGATLIEQSAPSDDIYFIEAGRAAIIMNTEAEAEVRLATIGAGAIVGEIAFYLGRPRSASVVAEEPLIVRRFTHASLARLREEAPDIAIRFHERLATMLAERLAATNKLVRYLAD